MHKEYEPQHIEPRIQKIWKESKVFAVKEDVSREKFYCLSMFPYPSGKLHMGHVRNYAIGDAIARYQRMLGKNVLQPIGFDAFGLPAENAAIEKDIHPATWTQDNISYMRTQLERLGFAYDWDRCFATCEPSYYKWEQWFFTQLLSSGIAYRKSAAVNWDPVDQTVLANEQVIDGRGWRSGALVEKREIEQWFFRITQYAEELLQGLDQLDGWPDSVKTMQRNWIGRSEGVEVFFTLQSDEQDASCNTHEIIKICGNTITIFTTRPDTLHGVTYLAVSFDHPLAKQVAQYNSDVARFIAQCQKNSTAEAALETTDKQGVALGLNVLHPVTNLPIPIWIANFVLMDYGTGAVMAVPAHDQRDWEFAVKYKLPIVPVIHPKKHPHDWNTGAFVGEGILRTGDAFDGMSSAEGEKAIIEFLVQQKKGSGKTHYRLRDWGVSRQRYWGCPIPIVYDADGTPVAIDERDLPCLLPESYNKQLDQQRIDDTGRRIEQDTFDTFVESSWYFARFVCPDLHEKMLDDRADYWLPVDQYVGGIEHAVLHLLYARFFCKLLRDQRLLKIDEPFKKLLTQGMVKAETYYQERDGKKIYYHPSEVDFIRGQDGHIQSALLKKNQQPVLIGGLEKMSKSKNNGVDPDHLIERYGADTVRVYTLFAAPPDQDLEWSDNGVVGASRFLKRVWRFIYEHLERSDVASSSTAINVQSNQDTIVWHAINVAIMKATNSMERQIFNTVIAAAMELFNCFVKQTPVSPTLERYGIECLLLLLAPFAPHFSQSLWMALGHQTMIVDATWPKHDPNALQSDDVTIVIQINGKLRDRIHSTKGANKDEIEKKILALPKIAGFLREKHVVKIVHVPDKLVNIVAK